MHPQDETTTKKDNLFSMKGPEVLQFTYYNCYIDQNLTSIFILSLCRGNQGVGGVVHIPPTFDQCQWYSTLQDPRQHTQAMLQTE